MIQTNSYNDFSQFEYGERTNYDFMMEQVKTFVKNGGDITLMVQHDKSEPLITFRDYIVKNIENPEDFFKELTLNSLLPSLCDMKWVPETGTIEEDSEYGIRWMHNHYSEFRDMIYRSIEELIKQLPSDLEKIKEFGEYSDGKIYYRETERYGHPLFRIATKIDEIEIYELIFKTYPNIKVEWEKTTPRGEPRFSGTIQYNYNRIDRPSMAIFYYKHGIGIDFLHQPENKDLLLPLIIDAARTGDIEFLQKILPKINLAELEKGEHRHEISLPRAKNAEIVNLLLDYGAIISQKIEEYLSDALFSDYITSLEVFDAIIKRSPVHLKMIKDNPEDIYNYMGRTTFEITKLLIEKYEFPLERFDMLSIAWEKNGDYEWLIKHGADTRQCASFCSKMVLKRDEGLKEIRTLAKQGLITPKSPDMVFNIFASNPTKLFLTYYDKLTHNDLEKTTLRGYPAWWGATSVTDYTFMFRRLSRPEQTAQDGKPFFFFALERQINESKMGRAKGLVEHQLKFIHKKNPDYKFDLSYTDHKGNNFLHYHVTMTDYKKKDIDSDFLPFMKEHSVQDPYKFYFLKNNEGITPLEVLLTQPHKNGWHTEHALKSVLDNAKEFIKFGEKFSDGKTVGEHLILHYKDNHEISSQIHSLILEQELIPKASPTTKKVKI